MLYPSPPIQLVDVSAAQGHIPPEVWARLAAGGVRGAIVKVTEGIWLDPTAAENLARAEDAGIVTSVYGFARMSLGPTAREQARKLWNACGPRMPAFPQTLDLETRPDGWSDERVIGWAEEWNDQAESDFGRPSNLYSFPYYLQVLRDRLTRSPLSRCRLWIAGGRGYVNGDGHVPELPREGPPLIAPWGSNWTLWQFDGNGGRKLPNGVDVDWNVFNGDEEAWAKFRGLPEAPPTVPELAIVHGPVPLGLPGDDED